MVLTTLLFFVLMNYAPLILSPLSPQTQLRVLLLIFVTTTIIPVISVIAFRYTAIVSDFEMKDRRERFLPFLFISIIYGLTAYLFYSKLQINENFVIILGGTTAILLIVTIMSLFWKISIHSAGISGVFGFLLAISYKYPESNLLYPIIAVVLCAGLVLSARMYLNAHTQEEVYGGTIVGFLVAFSSVYIFI